MKAIISTTYDDKYLYFLPIVSWCWNKLGVDVICFLPAKQKDIHSDKADLVINTIIEQELNVRLKFFKCPENKEATYSQCARLYGAAVDRLDEEDILVTSDIDMVVFKLPPYNGGDFTIWGNDLVPKGQIPMCYISGKVKAWKKYFQLEGKTYQECLDETIGKEECENMRGNLWCRDQETAHNTIMPTGSIWFEPRSNGQNQFAQNRVDRDDTNWRSYVNDELIDAHLWRSGFQDGNFENIMELLSMKYPNENLDWIRAYTQQYKALL